MNSFIAQVVYLSAIGIICGKSVDTNQNNDYIVVLKNTETSPDFHISQFNKFLKLNDVKSSIKIKDTYKTINGYSAKIPQNLIKTIENLPEVNYVEQDKRMYAYESQFDATWGLARICSRSKLNITNKNFTYNYDENAGSGVNVYVLDTGINTEHNEFEGRASFLENFSDSGDEDKVGHGTHCAGTIGGKKYGVAKKSNIFAVKALGDDGSGSYSDVIKAIDYTVSHAKNSSALKGNVASMSLGGNKSKAVNAAVNKAVENGIVFVVAAGNESSDACFVSPASAEKAITVGASTNKDTTASFSNYGKCLTVYAPGKDILSAWKGSKSASKTISGTSMAAPHVAGLAAYIMSLSETTLTPEEVKDAIIKTATNGTLEVEYSESPNLIIYNSFKDH